LSGGAHVVIATSRYGRATVEYYQRISQRFSSCGSALTVVPFNQGSKQDMGLDLNYVITFATVPGNGREIGGLDEKSELRTVSCL
jgi:fatty acid synthase subunit alpha